MAVRRRSMNAAFPTQQPLCLGLGAKVLIGGSRRTITLQPLSVEGQIGLNVAVGVANLTLR